MAISDILVGAPANASGSIFFAPVGTAGPADVRAALNAKFAKSGYVGEDGVTRSIDASDDKIKAWGGDTVKVVRTEHSVSYTWTFLESMNADVLKLLFGAENVTVAANGDVSVNITSRTLPHQAVVFEMRDGDYKVREFVPDGQLSLTGDTPFSHSGLIQYEVTLEAFADDAGVKAKSMFGKATTA